MKRWLQRDSEKAHRGQGEPPVTGDLHFVDEQGSMALVGDRFYINGQPAPEGEHEITLPGLPPDRVFAVTVDAKGKASRKMKAKVQAQGKPKGGK